MAKCVYCGVETGDEHDEHPGCVELAAWEALTEEEILLEDLLECGVETGEKRNG